MRRVALIGLGVIGVPIAHKLYKHYGDDFCLIASGQRRERLEGNGLVVNGDDMRPRVISRAEELGGPIDLLLVCVKNYHLATAMDDIERCVSPETVIFPLQNGIYSSRLFASTFPNNIVLNGYVQGPNTERGITSAVYQNPGALHVGSEKYPAAAHAVENMLAACGLDITFEEDIRRMVWKKWMLNVAGNSVTALTGADYGDFSTHEPLVALCRMAMSEFLQVAHAEGVGLTEADVDDVIDYYLGYRGGKKTSMLVDVLSRRRTENEYLAGTAVRLAEDHGINVPSIRVLYRLIQVKEELYLDSGKKETGV